MVFDVVELFEENWKKLLGKIFLYKFFFGAFKISLFREDNLFLVNFSESSLDIFFLEFFWFINELILFILLLRLDFGDKHIYLNLI